MTKLYVYIYIYIYIYALFDPVFCVLVEDYALETILTSVCDHMYISVCVCVHVYMYMCTYM